MNRRSKARCVRRRSTAKAATSGACNWPDQRGVSRVRARSFRRCHRKAAQRNRRTAAHRARPTGSAMPCRSLRTRTPCAAIGKKRSRMRVPLCRTCSAEETRPGCCWALRWSMRAMAPSTERSVFSAYVEREFGRAGRIFFPMLAHVRDEIVSRARARSGAGGVRPSEGGRRRADRGTGSCTRLGRVGAEKFTRTCDAAGHRR